MEFDINPNPGDLLFQEKTGTDPEPYIRVFLGPTTPGGKPHVFGVSYYHGLITTFGSSHRASVVVPAEEWVVSSSEG